MPTRYLFVILALAAAPAALAQPAFTEVALVDTLLVTPEETDFWITSVAPADADADGDLDLLVLGYYVIYGESAEDVLVLYRNDGPDDAGGWAFTPSRVPLDELPADYSDLAWGDYDGDGDPDLVLATDGTAALYRNDDGVLVRTATELPIYYEDSLGATIDLRSLSWADFDNDGDLDLLFPAVIEEAGARRDERSGFSYVRTKLLRNDGPDTGDAWTFTDTEAPLDTTSHAQSAWGDMDGDGDLDLMLANVTIWQPGNNLSLFRNDDGALVRVATGLAHIRYGSADWNDADGDGDLDIVIVGNLDRPDGTGETVVRVLYDAGDGTFTPVEVITAFEDGWLDFGAVSWADYDGDGDVDLLVAGMAFGEDNLEGRSSVYVNDGGTFVLATDLPAPLDGQAGGAFTWFDLDGDGDLDHFVAGAYYVPGGNGLVEARAQLFRNDAPAANGPPSAPSALQATPGPDGVALSWAPAADDTTPSASLTYALHVRPAGAQAPGAHPLPEAGNVSFNTDWTVRGLPDGSYDWEVRALDNAYAAGPVAAGTFVVGTTAAESESVGTAAALQTPHPNPARGRSRFTLTLAEAQAVTIAVFDGLGRRVAVLHEGPLPAGEHALALDGAGLPAGAYVVRATGETFTAARRVTLLR